jgi:hypothetical protein
VLARKSLILEASATMSRSVFATSRAVFATSPVFGPFAAALFFSLSKSLKKKKKKYVEGQEINRKAVPRVRGVLICLISSGHINLGERPRLLQLNNTAA